MSGLYILVFGVYVDDVEIGMVGIIVKYIK